MRKMIVAVVLLAICCSGWMGCSPSQKNREAYKDVSYTVVKRTEIPKEAMELIQNQGEREFQMVYKSDGWLYVMRGYGVQKTGGYSIRIQSVRTQGERLFVKSELVGPQTKEEQKGGSSYPYIVIKLEDPGYPVSFEEAGGSVDGIDQEESASDLSKE